MENKKTAYSEALALESIGKMGRWDEEDEVYNKVTNKQLERYARTVAYKVAHNIKNGSEMNPDLDPLKYTGEVK